MKSDQPPGTLIGIAIKPKKRAALQEFEYRRVTRSLGVAGDHRGRESQRQVTVLCQESWLAACNELGSNLPWTDRRANLLVTGLELTERVGYFLQIGDLVLEITGETTPCDRMDDARSGLQAALHSDWRGGVTCRVIEDGTISIGDPVFLYRHRQT